MFCSPLTSEATLSIAHLMIPQISDFVKILRRFSRLSAVFLIKSEHFSVRAITDGRFGIIIIKKEASDLNDDRLRRLSRLAAVAACGILLLYITLKHLLPAILPILAACLLSSVTRPAAKYVARKSRMPEKLCGAVITVLFLFFSLYALVVVAGKLTHELFDAVHYISASLDSDDNIIRRAMSSLSSLRERLPSYSIGDGRADELYELLVGWVKGGVGALSEGLTERIARLVGSLPRLALSLGVCVVALLYLTLDTRSAGAIAAELVPRPLRDKLSRVAERLGAAVSSYVKAYSILLLLTFAELLLGFVILRIRYAFLWAMLIAVLDALPLLGVGTVLLPWAAVALLCKNVRLGGGLLIMLCVMYCVRQLTEARIIGRFMGIHPLITLTGAFMLYSLFGFWGMLLSPLILHTLLSLTAGDR